MFDPCCYNIIIAVQGLSRRSKPRNPLCAGAVQCNRVGPSPNENKSKFLASSLKSQAFMFKVYHQKLYTVLLYGINTCIMSHQYCEFSDFALHF